MTTSQINAVFQAVCSVLNKTSFDSAVELSKEERNNVVNIVTEGILANKVDFSTEAKAKYNTSKLVREYVVGMVSNHLRRDKRLNGGIQDIPKTSRPKDEQLKALKTLRDGITDPEQLAQVDQAIAERTAELQQAKPKATINIDALPENLRYLVK
jgi:vacuolar-type H+-ATPase subunit I/STV1